MDEILKRFDRGSLFVILVTLVLFGVSLFLTGFTHDLLLEAGVFLISVKLIIMSDKNSIAAGKLGDQLSDIRATLGRLENTWVAKSSPDAEGNGR